MRILSLVVLSALTACSVEPAPDPANSASPTAPSAEPVTTPSPAPADTSPSAAAPPIALDNASEPEPQASGANAIGERGPIAARLIRSEWAKAENRRQCAPIGFTADGGANGKPRRAYYGGGWAIAWDVPDTRSAYGVAGPGLGIIDNEDPKQQRARLAEQWPYFRDLPHLPRSSFAGYGVSGAEAYPDSNPDGRGVQSLAYVRIGGQRCTYNVWSRIGRKHLETLLDRLVLLDR